MFSLQLYKLVSIVLYSTNNPRKLNCNYSVLNAVREIFVWWVAIVLLRGEWKCVLTDSGGRCAMITGMARMHKSYAGS